MSPDNQYLQFGNDYLSPPSTSDIMPAFSYQENATDFVNPGAIAPFDTLDSIKPEVALVSAPPPITTAPPMATAGRYYPGIHQQQAVYQQQQIWQQQLQKSQQAKTALSNSVEESVDKIMNSLRIHKAPSSSARSPSVLPNIPKLKKKDEDDMDEDERLLASEEGKKLTSKERRQLRNKVSARAFRSRRKGYIMDLEEEIRKSKDENTELQSENTRLREENAKISEFTKTLLSSPAFSAYLAATIESGTISSAPEPMTTTTSNPEPVRPNTRKDVNPNLASVSEDAWPLAYNNSPWATNSSTVFAVLELPEGPNIQDLSGKMTTDDSCDDHKLNPLPPVADGFYPFRSEKDFVPNNYHWEDDDEYEAPEDLMDAYDEEFAMIDPKEQEDAPRKSLDELFPGHGVSTLLERLEMIVGGQAKPEDFFEEVTLAPAQETTQEMSQDIEKELALVEANGLLDAVEGVYKRIGLVVGS
jgi:hypothetical protein